MTTSGPYGKYDLVLEARMKNVALLFEKYVRKLGFTVYRYRFGMIPDGTYMFWTHVEYQDLVYDTEYPGKSFATEKFALEVLEELKQGLDGFGDYIRQNKKLM